MRLRRNTDPLRISELGSRTIPISAGELGSRRRVLLRRCHSGTDSPTQTSQMTTETTGDAPFEPQATENFFKEVPEGRGYAGLCGPSGRPS
jgi:hypothetical protein